ncbi:MAG: hypothetical protein E7185_02665 [Erysipelotrichaceae bacterium]|nr:hypothetical protein [Erysipelotrichaceae bacterium]
MMKKPFFIPILLFSLTACSSSGAAVDSSDIQMKEITVYNDTLRVPESAFVEDSEDEDVKFIFFENDEKDENYKWKNYCIVNICGGVNETPDITYSMGKVVLDDYTNAFLSMQTDFTNVKKEAISLPQTPAYHITADAASGKGKYIVYSACNSFHDTILFYFYHSNSADKDYSDIFDEMVRNTVFNDLTGDKAFKPDQDNTVSSSNSSSSDSDKEYRQLAIRVYEWCQERFEYYDEKDGYYTGDKYDKEVFEDAAKYFGKTYSEINQLYTDGGRYWLDER